MPGRISSLTPSELAQLRARSAKEKHAWRRGSHGAASACRRIDPATGAVIDHDIAASDAAANTKVLSDLESDGDGT